MSARTIGNKTVSSLVVNESSISNMVCVFNIGGPTALPEKQRAMKAAHEFCKCARACRVLCNDRSSAFKAAY